MSITRISLGIIIFYFTCNCAVAKSEEINLHVLNSKARNLLRSHPDSTILLATIALNQARQLDSARQEGIALNNIGIAKYYLGEMDSAIAYNQKAIDVFLSISDSIKYADVLINLGNIMFERGDYVDATSNYESALIIYNNHNYIKGRAKAINNIGNTFYSTGDYKNALEYYFEALEIEYERNNVRGQAICNNNIGIMYHKLHKNNESIKYFSESLKIYDKLQEQQNKATVFNQIGASYVTMQNYDSALFYFNKGLDLAISLNYRVLVAVFENNLGEVLLLTKNYDQAKSHFEKAYDINKELGDNEGTCRNLLGIGMVLNHLGKDVQAQNILLQAFDKAIQINSYELIKNASLELSSVYESLKQPKDALRYYKKYKAFDDSLLNRSNIEKITTLKMQYDFNIEQNKRELIQLQKEAKHRDEIRELRIRQWRIVTFAVLFIFTSAIVFIALNYRQKNRINRLKIEINRNVQRLLGQQMNPHFIFNTLKSIQNFILKNDTKKSNLYLTRFSKLIRKILDNSQSEFISLKDEMEALELYMELENLRLNNKFDFKIRIDEQITPTDLNIPSLLFQPFVENAIWHGISKKESRGIIRIEIERIAEELVCSISDDGVGRNQSLEEDKKHKSLGSEITNKRISLLNSLYKMAIEPKIVDLYSSQGKAEGTRVEFKLPCMDNI